ncbi:unnamed protein product [Psylliodes chrysocephalus]|uniref:Gustatory receptor n=1 Tax=Psylliodes chrysocephalus TaxID=3402493 RepID=A0A9P0GK91_9CUCU|nr:unnamed protein product [Psylliodes chrysocephala]
MFYVTNLFIDRFKFINIKIFNLMSDTSNYSHNLFYINKFLKITSKIINEINKNLGWTLLFCQFGVIGFTNDVIEMLIKGSENSFLLLFYLLFFLLLVVLISFQCNRVEKCGEKISRICYKLHFLAEDEAIKQDLFVLAMYAKRWKPVFSAAGFNNINQSTLNFLFFAVVTNFVIILQFGNMTNNY